MATEFLPFDDLVERVGDASFDRAPAIICNAHITGLGVARALDARGVPVIALDRTGQGAAPFSDAVDFAGQVTFPLDDEAGFGEDLERLAAALDHDPVAFGCMDEWALALAETEPEGVRLPFAADRVDAVLDKESLYATAEELGVPYPETYRLDEVSVDEAADALAFPFVIKPARKREFEEAVGTNVIEVADRAELEDVVTHAREADISVMAQEKVPIAVGEDCSLASYVPPSNTVRRAPESADSGRPEGEAVAITGNARVRYPRAFGTSCVVDVVDQPEVRKRALSVLAETGYYGISEAEFVYDSEREDYVLLDINTRPWKWIGLPVAAGANLPFAAYADATGEEYEPDPAAEGRWTYLPDYLSLLAGDDSFADVFTKEQWLSLVSGAFEHAEGLTTGVYSPSDPEPLYRVLKTEFGPGEYYCSC